MVANIPANLLLQLVNLQQGRLELLASPPLPPHRSAPLMVSHSISHWKVLKQQHSSKWRGALTFLCLIVSSPFEG